MKRSNQVQIIVGILALVVVVAFAQQGAAIHAQSGTAAATAAAGAATAAPVSSGGSVTLTLAGYSVIGETYADIIPLFKDYWFKKTGQTVTFKESYGGSGAQARAVAGGLKADIVSLSLESDVTSLVKAKLITHDWQSGDYKGMVADTVAVLAVPTGNPKGIKDWGDIAAPGIEVITPNPATSGGAQWNILAAYGAALRGNVPGYDKSEDGATKLISGIFTNVSVLDKDARSSILTFQKGIGDVAITYESETVAARAAQAASGDTSGAFDVVYPTSTILIENPVALVDAYVDQNGTRPAAEAFIQFLYTPEIQRVFAKHGYRPVVSELATDDSINNFPPIKDLFTVAQFGGWPKVSTDLFGTNGKLSQLLISIKGSN